MESIITLILGSKGMLGSELVQVFSDYHPISWDIEDLDITNLEEVEKKIGSKRPDLIINAAAYTDVDGAEKNQDIAFKTNRDAVGYLAKVSHRIGAILVHYSTEYVFKGDNPKGYKEDDIPSQPLNIYGQSKLLGENLLKIQCQRYYLIRTSSLFGSSSQPGSHQNFVETILKLGAGQSEIKVVNDQYHKPAYTLDLAKRTREIIETRKPFGVYHLTNEGVTTWYDFAKKIIELSHFKTRIIPFSTKDLGRPAKRPKWSILNNTKLPLMRNWNEALKDYLYLTLKLH
ncbi:MAG: dTDP-4-dehydrorhamnose reductase [Candidatus Aminicenantia bacterium]